MQTSEVGRSGELFVMLDKSATRLQEDSPGMWMCAARVLRVSGRFWNKALVLPKHYGQLQEQVHAATPLPVHTATPDQQFDGVLMHKYVHEFHVPDTNFGTRAQIMC